MKKILGTVGLAAVAAGLFMTTQSVDSSSNVSLTDVMHVNKANAECNINRVEIERNFGFCSRTPEFKCYWSVAYPTEYSNCDPYQQ